MCILLVKVDGHYDVFALLQDGVIHLRTTANLYFWQLFILHTECNLTMLRRVEMFLQIWRWRLLNIIILRHIRRLQATSLRVPRESLRHYHWFQLLFGRLHRGTRQTILITRILKGDGIGLIFISSLRALCLIHRIIVLIWVRLQIICDVHHGLTQLAPPIEAATVFQSISRLVFSPTLWCQIGGRIRWPWYGLSRRLRSRRLSRLLHLFFHLSMLISFRRTVIHFLIYYLSITLL